MIRRCFACLALLVGATPLSGAAQGIAIQTPQLPARGQAGIAPPAQAASPQPPTDGNASQPTAAMQPTQATPSSPGQMPAGQTPGYASASASSAAPVIQPLGSPLQQRATGGGLWQAFTQTTAPGYAGGAGGSSPPVAMVVPTPSAPGGNCRVQPSPDRQTLSLVGPDGQPRRHVPLGDFRVQRIAHSPDGRWAVALTKLRGEPQFAALMLNLERCETTHAVDLPSAGTEVSFESSMAVVQLGTGEQRVPLVDPRRR